MKKPGESPDDLRARVTKSAQNAEEGIPFPGDSKWTLGEQRRNRGSVHSDIWTGPAADLARRDQIAVYPVTGWWKERPHLDRWRDSVRYALVVSIRTPAVGVDIYTPVVAMVAVPTGVEVR
jgi:hypothetical protein